MRRDAIVDVCEDCIPVTDAPTGGYVVEHARDRGTIGTCAKSNGDRLRVAHALGSVLFQISPSWPRRPWAISTE